MLRFRSLVVAALAAALIAASGAPASAIVCGTPEMLSQLRGEAQGKAHEAPTLVSHVEHKRAGSKVKKKAAKRRDQLVRGHAASKKKPLATRAGKKHRKARTGFKPFTIKITVGAPHRELPKAKKKFKRTQQRQQFTGFGSRAR